MDDAYDASNHWFASDIWKNRYNGIRACNQFLANAKPSVIGNAEKPGDDNKLYERWCAEVRVIRALLHFDLIGYFGAIPLVADDEEGNPIILSPGVTLPERTSAEEALKWVADEMDVWKDKLPFRHANEDENWGRVNGAAAYALKSRALLYRASALNNPSGDKGRWQEAATAALDFIAKNNTVANKYRLHRTTDNDPQKNYYDVFTSDPVMSNEYILSRSVWNTLNLVYFNGPCGFSGKLSNTGYNNPTQNLVDAYETTKGLTIENDPDYDPQNPYANRDPRLAQTIFHHGMTWGDGDEARTHAVTAVHVPDITAKSMSTTYVSTVPWATSVWLVRYSAMPRFCSTQPKLLPKQVRQVRPIRPPKEGSRFRKESAALSADIQSLRCHYQYRRPLQLRIVGKILRTDLQFTQELLFPRTVQRNPENRYASEHRLGDVIPPHLLILISHENIQNISLQRIVGSHPSYGCLRR